MNLALDAVQWLRPHWLWALLALPLLAALWQRRRRHQHAWRDAVDAHLLPHLLVAAPARRTWPGALAAALGYVLAVLALAGPSWREGPQPLWSGGRPAVIALDLSTEMLAADLPPSRLAQARAKLAQLLAQRDGAPVALVVFAEDAYTVAPLTTDAANVALFIDALAPDAMPVDGQRAERAIAWSAELLRRGRHAQGDIVLLTGAANARAQRAAADARAAGYRVSVIGLGTVTGAPYRSMEGAIRQARLDEGALVALARAGGGAYAPLSADERDLRALDLRAATGAGEATSGQGRMRQDEGYWLLLPLMLLGVLAFRPRAGVAMLALALCLPSTPAHAVDWWQRPDQAAHARMQQGVEAYRQKRFEEAAALFRGVEGAPAHYNRGNALARAGRFEQAIAAYDEALRLQPGMPDAIANRRAVEAAMKRKPPPGPGDGAPRDDPAQSGQPGPPGEGQGDPARPPAGAASAPAGAPPSKPKIDPEAAQRAQREADAAQRERMQRELERARGGTQAPPEGAVDETPAARERRLVNEAALRRVPDDPGGLLRAKLRIEHERRQREGGGP